MEYLNDLFTLVSMEDRDNGFAAQLRCNPSHPVYRAHFPGNPITPGACLLKTSGELLQNKAGRPLYLKLSKNIKYLSLLIPEEGKEVRFVFTNLASTEDGCKAQLVIEDDATVYSKMSLTYSYEPL